MLFRSRYDAGVQLARKLLHEELKDLLGEVLFARVYCFSRDYEAEFPSVLRTDERRPAGQELWAAAPEWVPAPRAAEYDWFINRSVHQVNLIRFLFGDSVTVRHANLANREGGFVTFETERHPVVLEVGTPKLSAWHEGVEIFFQKGRMLVEIPSPLDRSFMARVTVERGEGASEVKVFPRRMGWCFDRQAQSFVKLTRGVTASNLSSGADSVKDYDLTERIWRLELARAADSAR